MRAARARACLLALARLVFLSATACVAMAEVLFTLVTLASRLAGSVLPLVIGWCRRRPGRMWRLGPGAGFELIVPDEEIAVSIRENHSCAPFDGVWAAGSRAFVTIFRPRAHDRFLPEAALPHKCGV